MKSARALLTLTFSFAATNAFVNFNEDPACVPDGIFTPEHLPFICKFEADAEYDPGFDCTDLPEECTSDQAKATWAFSKRHVESQDTDGLGCGGMGNVLSREPEFPECIFGRVPEMRVLDVSEVIQDSRQLAEKILSGNPTNCAVRLAMQIYDIYGAVGSLRLSEVALHGLRFNPKNKLAQLKASWDESTNDCVVPDATNKEDSDAIEERLQSRVWSFDRKVYADEECTLIKHYNGSPFAKDHDGGFEGCKIECMRDPNCNGFNMDLKFDVTIKQPACDLLDCPTHSVTKEAKFGHVSFAVDGRRIIENRGRFDHAAKAPLFVLDD